MDAQTAELIVSGMTCQHCVGAVESELSAVDGVERVSVDLVAGGDSRVTVSLTRPVGEAALIEAVDEAGYEARLV